MSALLRNATKKEEIDLITRYNLQNRVKSSDKGKAREDSNTSAVAGVDGEGKEGSSTGTGSGTQPSGWAATKDARQGILQRRRDEMILEARRRMLERDATGGTSTTSGRS